MIQSIVAPHLMTIGLLESCFSSKIELMKTSPEQRDKLKILTASFARIHKMLLELQMSELEKISGSEIKPAARLNLLLGDPDFAWLRNLSQLMAIADDVYFQKEEISAEQMSRIQNASQDLFIRETQAAFTKRYQSAARKLSPLMMEHAKLLSILKEI